MVLNETAASWKPISKYQVNMDIFGDQVISEIFFHFPPLSTTTLELLYVSQGL